MEKEESLIAGNAAKDGKDFDQWFVGDIERWMKNKKAPCPGRFGLRNTRILEVKWGIHPEGEKRPNGWSSLTEKKTLSILIRGCFTIYFRQAGHKAAIRKITLENTGAYVIWDGGLLEHTWEAAEESVVLSVRWRTGGG